MATPTFTVGGLASGMDTQSIIDKLVQLESLPLTTLQKQQSAFKTQISILGDLASRLNDLKAAASKLASGGVTALETTSSNTAFSATPGTGATAGSYDVAVTTLATAAKWRSGAFASNDTMQAGTLRITVGGKVYPPTDTPLPDGTPPITVDSQTTLDSLASAIRATGAPVSVSVLDDGTSKYLSITNLDTGYTGQQADALKVDFTPTAGPAAALWTPSFTQAADNADFTVDGLEFTRTSNTVSDAVPGTTLTLKQEGGPAETLSIGTDVTGTETALKTYVDAYNKLISAVQQQLAVTKGTDRSTTLAGDSTLQSLQQQLQVLGSSIASGSGTVRSLADLGISTQRDGTLSIDSSLLASAVGREPSSVNAIFADATTGIGQQLSTLASTYSSVTGLLASRENALQDRVHDMDDQAAELQARIDAFHDRLVAQFTAMENVVSNLKSIGNFLTSQDTAKKS